MSVSRRFDVVLWGATGFTGQLVAEYFATSVSKSLPHIRWALAGRSRDKLDAVKSEVQARAEQQGLSCDPELLVGSATDQESVDAIVSSTKVMLCTAGPFINLGTPIVDACVRFGTDYTDITGETPWVRSLIDRYGAEAEASGCYIVPMCGFDSIPSDLGTYNTVRALRAKANDASTPLRRVRNYVTMQGGLSGGTLETGINMERLGLLPQLQNPFLLGGQREGGVRDEDRDVTAAEKDATFGAWTAPFGMAELNTRVVRRSNALMEEHGGGEASGYGAQFAYSERALAPNKKVAEKLARGNPPIEKRIELVKAGRLPAQGQGPSREDREKSWFKFYLVGEGESGDMAVTSVSGGDPGYTETAKMVAETSLCLVEQREEMDARRRHGVAGGVLTPAFAFGQVLVDRLHAAGIKFEDEELPQPPSKL